MNVMRNFIARILIFTGFCLMGIGLACQPSALLNPPQGPGTAYPCGYFGVSCMPYDGTHTCCGEHYKCIQDGCEYEGNSDIPPEDLLGSRKQGPPKRLERFSEQ
jgi:hypothetical protein